MSEKANKTLMVQKILQNIYIVRDLEVVKEFLKCSKELTILKKN